MKTIITISREFGSGGRFIGETLAKELNFTFYDKNIIEQVAKETGFSKEYMPSAGNMLRPTTVFLMHSLEEMHKAAL